MDHTVELLGNALSITSKGLNELYHEGKVLLSGHKLSYWCRRTFSAEEVQAFENLRETKEQELAEINKEVKAMRKDDMSLKILLDRAVKDDINKRMNVNPGSAEVSTSLQVFH